MPSCKKKFIFIFFLFAHLFSEDYPKIGLVLSGGGSKGFAHIATLKALDSLNIPIDYIAGTSFGAIVGAMYSLGYSGKQIEEMAIATDFGYAPSSYNNIVIQKHIQQKTKKQLVESEAKYRNSNLNSI